MILHIGRRRILAVILGITTSLAPVAIVSSWAGPAQDKALRDAAGCVPAVGFDIDGVKAALKSGADPNAPSTDGWPQNTTPLGCMAVVLHGNIPNDNLNRRAVEIAQLLFDAGAKLGPADREVLFSPIYSGNLEMVRLLIDKGASPTAKLGNFTPAELARMYRQSAVYDYLISRGEAPVDSESAAQMVLVEAARNADIATMERALKDGAFINGTDPDGSTALDEAGLHLSLYAPNRTAAKSSVAALWWLLDHGADPNQGRLPALHGFLIMSRESPAGMNPPDARPMAEETLARLLKAGATVSGRDRQGRTPLHVAAEADEVWAAEVLIEAGAKVMPEDESRKTPLDYAESAPMIKLLKASGATER